MSDIKFIIELLLLPIEIITTIYLIKHFHPKTEINKDEPTSKTNDKLSERTKTIITLVIICICILIAHSFPILRNEVFPTLGYIMHPRIILICAISTIAIGKEPKRPNQEYYESYKY